MPTRLVSSLLVITATTVSAGERKALMSDSAADMVGVNTHLNYRDTPYYTDFDEIIRPRLIESGIRHIRDNPGNSQIIMDRYGRLARDGISVLMINSRQPDHFQYVRRLNTDYGLRVVEAVEPPNERDSWTDEMKQHMLAIWGSYRKDPATTDVLILAPSYANTRSGPGNFANFWPEAENCLHRGNTHDYSGTYPEGPLGGGWGFSHESALKACRALCGDKPIWATENGYKNSRTVPGHPAVTERAAAKYMPRQMLLHLSNGVQRFYIYQLINCKPNATHEDFGLLNDDGSPRQQYTAVRNFIKLFADPGPEFETGSLDYSLIGDTKDVYSVLLQKRSGRFYLALWQGVESSVYARSDEQIADIEPPARKLTLKLDSPISHATTWFPTFSDEPLERTTRPTGINQLQLSVPDHILVIELRPRDKQPSSR